MAKIIVMTGTIGRPYHESLIDTIFPIIGEVLGVKVKQPRIVAWVVEKEQWKSLTRLNKEVLEEVLPAKPYETHVSGDISNDTGFTLGLKISPQKKHRKLIRDCRKSGEFTWAKIFELLLKNDYIVFLNFSDIIIEADKIPRDDSRALIAVEMFTHELVHVYEEILKKPLFSDNLMKKILSKALGYSLEKEGSCGRYLQRSVGSNPTPGAQCACNSSILNFFQSFL